LWRSIQAEFEALGGDAGQTFTFTSGGTDLKGLMAEVKASEPEAVVFIAPSFDTALMVQYGRQQGLQAQLYSSGWAATEVLLEKGGRAIEGIELVTTYNDKNPYPAFRDFLRRFEKRYGRQPTFSAAFSYEAVLVLARALEETGGQASGLPEALTAVKDLEGVQGPISMDEYGDVERDVYITIVRKGQFEIIHTIPAQD
jgi:branched-chain amino acid transport system substrate-binding protein